jgi:hypothetical protein
MNYDFISFFKDMGTARLSVILEPINILLFLSKKMLIFINKQKVKLLFLKKPIKNCVAL